MTQEPDFCRHAVLAKSTKKHWDFMLKEESKSTLESLIRGGVGIIGGLVKVEKIV